MNNIEIFELSKRYIPGGVNSPVRAFKGLSITPPIVKRGEGPYVFDEEDKKYIDFVCAWGPMILGHCDEDVVNSIKGVLDDAISFGAPTKLELTIARFICETVGIDMIRFVNSGTEATMSAIRLARGYTRRSMIVKFSGCYHGHYDGFLVAAGSGVMTHGIPGSEGVPLDLIRNTIVAEFNDTEGIKEIFRKFGEDIAGVIIEPIAGNMGVIPSEREFLLELRRLCDEYGSLLIFDEVMTGFRVSYGGAKEIYGIQPDLITYAKIIGGGLPCGAYGGRRDIMEKLAPIGPVYQAGTMSGNPVVMAAGYATLRKLYENRDNFYDYLDALGERMEVGIKEIAKEKGMEIVVNRVGSMITAFFTEEIRVKNYADALKCNVGLFRRFAEHMIKNGIYIPPSQFEAMFISVKHTEDHIEEFLRVMKKF